MARHLHLDCFSGISGDMFLGSLIDAGLSLPALKRGLQALDVGGYRLQAKKVHRGSLSATKFDVKIRSDKRKPFSLSRIQRTIKKSGLPPGVKTQSLHAFELLAQAERKVHGMAPSKIHFHEVGVIDSFVDVVGGFLGCHLLNITTVSTSAVNMGAGIVDTEHGTLPVPGPAVAHLAIQVPVFSSGPIQELTTPTGLSLVTTLTKEFTTLPRMVPQRIGYGAGTQDPPHWPNVLRVFLGELADMTFVDVDRVLLLETNVDDLNPQIYEAVMDRLFSVGALDVTLTPVIMKRGRPGIVISVLASHPHAESVIQTLFHETSTLGVRVQEVSRRILPRTMKSLRLKKGTVRVKFVQTGDRGIKYIPEYQDCKRLAEKTGRPVREVIEEVIHRLKMP